MEVTKFKKILETKQEELERIVRNRDAITIEKSADALDEVQHASERELAIRNLDRESNLLRNVRAALRRIEDGSFGTCLHCEEEISPKRVAAVPWAPFCIQCQEQADKAQAEGSELLEDILVNAA
jgi:DnaK suppressor protein